MKSGISLIAVLLFMLAATTASIVVFRYIGQEGFASGARLKNNEAYQASQAGLEAVQGWLANKGADAGAIIRQFKKESGKPVLLVNNDNHLNLLGSINSNKQNFKVYLTGIDVSKQPYQLKFMSVGESRDGAKYSQIGIFDVEGLYNISIARPSEPGTAPEVPAFHGGLGQNTQGKFSSATIIGDATLNGLSTTGDLIVTGNLTVMDNSYSFIGCKNPPNSLDSTGNMYIVGSWHARGYKICGDAYIGGLLETTSDPQFRGNLYANSGIKNNGIRVYKNATLGGDLITGTAQATFDGNLIMEGTAKIEVQDGSKVSVGGSVWNMNTTGLFKGQNNNDKYKNLVMGGSGKYLYISKPPAEQCDNNKKENCNNFSYSWYQLTTGSNYAHFTSQATYIAPTTGNKLIYPSGANPLTSMAEQITKDNNGKFTVEDPLEVPADMKQEWLAKGKKLDSLVNITNNTTGLPLSCVRLVKRPENANNDYASHWGFGDGVQNCAPADYPSAGMKQNNGEQGKCTSSKNDYNFIRAANDCYAALTKSDPKGILYQRSSSEKFLALVVNNPQEKSPAQYDFLNGNFIFAYTADLGATMKLPPTTDNSKIFLYFELGSTKSLPLENTCLGLPTPCKRNYFIFSEKDFAGSSGTATINGAIFLANGSKITGMLPDAIIEFNKDLYKALTDVGVIKGTNQSNKQSDIPPEELQDDYYVPSTSHLKVGLQSRYASKEKIPKTEGTDFIYAKPSILVLPRVIYLKEGTVANTDELKKYYKVLYLNGAPSPSGNENQAHECNFNNAERGTNKEYCKLTSKSDCGNDCENHPFYVVTYDDDTFSNGGGGGGGNGDGGEETGTTDPDGATLRCNMPQSGSVFPYGTAVSAPSVTCSKGSLTGTTTWSPNIAWGSTSLAPGSYNNIRATANCGSGNITSNSCGNFSVMNPNVTLTCNISGSIKAGSPIPKSTSGNFTLTLAGCTSGAPTNISYPNISDSPSAGTYSNVVVSADCGAAKGLQVQCEGSLNVVGLKCSDLQQYVKAGATIGKPNLTCVPNNLTQTGTATWKNGTSTISMPFSVPADASAGTNYNIEASSIKCGNESNLTASCGRTTVSGITCTNLPTSVQKGGKINSEPNISCISGENATSKTFYQSTSDYQYATGSFGFPWTLGTALRYFVTAQATCGSETGLRANCGVVNAVDNSICQYEGSMCPGFAVDQVVTASQDGQLGGNNVSICVFATSIAKMGNESGGNGSPLKVNGVVLKHGDNSTQAGRCGNTGWGQKTCADALASVPKIDGGYYIYIPNWVGEFQTTGGTPFCSGGTSICDFNPDWCGGDGYAVNVDHGTKNPPKGSTNPAPSAGAKKKCSYIKDFNSIKYTNGSTLMINGIEYDCEDNDGCTIGTSGLSKPPTADGGYYVYLKVGEINDWNVNTTSCTGTIQTGSPSCNPVAMKTVATNCKNKIGSLEASPNPPLNPLTACFEHTDGKCYVCDNNNTSTNSSNCLLYSCWSTWLWDGKNVNATNLATWYKEVPCDGSNASSSSKASSSSAQSSSSVPSSSSVSSSSSVPSSSSVSLTCTLAKTSVALGESINAPTLSCTNGNTPTNKSFSNSNGSIANIGNWNNNSPTYYTNRPSTGTTAITVNATCGSTNINSFNCGNITVNNPTCNGLPTTVASGNGGTFTPTINCGGSTNIANSNFTPGTNCSWNASGTSGYFTRTATGNCTLTLNNFSCNGNSLSGLSIPCCTGNNSCTTAQNVNVTVGAASSSSGTCTSTFTFNESSVNNTASICGSSVNLTNNSTSKTCGLICANSTSTSLNCGNSIWLNANQSSNVNVNSNSTMTLTCNIPTATPISCKVSSCW
jgi:hypothetical protein